MGLAVVEDVLAGTFHGGKHIGLVERIGFEACRKGEHVRDVQQVKPPTRGLGELDGLLESTRRGGRFRRAEQECVGTYVAPRLGDWASLGCAP